MAFINRKKRLTYLVTLCICILGTIANTVHAEQKVSLGTWDVHYMALTSTFLTPEVAKNYGVLRSKYNGLINISVLDQKDKSAQSVVLTGQAKNLLGVVKDLSFHQVIEGQAIYYLAVLPFSDQEQYRITVNISDGVQQKTLKFQHKFYAE